AGGSEGYRAVTAGRVGRVNRPRVHLVKSGESPSGTQQIQRATRKLRRLHDSREIKNVPRIDFAIGPISMPVGLILVIVIHSGAIAGIRPAHVVADAMGEGVIPVQIDAMTATVLDLKEHPVIVLRSPVDNHSQSADFFPERRILKAQSAAILRVAGGRAGSAR